MHWKFNCISVKYNGTWHGILCYVKLSSEDIHSFKAALPKGWEKNCVWLHSYQKAKRLIIRLFGLAAFWPEPSSTQFFCHLALSLGIGAEPSFYYEIDTLQLSSCLLLKLHHIWLIQFNFIKIFPFFGLVKIRVVHSNFGENQG